MLWYAGYGGRIEPREPAGYQCRACGEKMVEGRPEPDALPEWSYCPECLKYGVAVWCWEGGGWQIKCNLCGGEVWDAQTDN
jgi:hypothetical protein